MKEYKVSDLFYDNWRALKPAVHERVATLHYTLKEMDPGTIEYGVTLIAILRALRRNWRLVDKINVEQAVDIFNDLTFLNEPWYHFPKISSDVRTPDENMARSSFDQFIYADNEFTTFISLSLKEREQKGEVTLARLAATIYPLYHDQYFDPAVVEDRAPVFQKNKHAHLMLVFLTFGHVRNFVVNRCRHLLPKGPVNDEPIRPSGPMWHTIKHQAARTLVFGNFNDLGKAGMYSVLDHLELLAKENNHQHAHT